MKIFLKVYLILVSVSVLVFTYAAVNAQQNLKIDGDSKANFTAEWFGVDIEGMVTGFKGDVVFNSSSLTSSTFNVSVDANTVHTGNATIDKHLKKEQLLHTAKYPSMSFISTMVSRNGNGFIVSGLLTIKGISKPVSFPFQTSVQDDEEVFTGNFRFEREDFDIGGGIAISKTIDVRLQVKVSKSPYLLK